MKKVKVILIAIFSTLVLLFGYWEKNIPFFVFPVLISILYYIAAYWILEFDIDFIGLFTLLLFPSIMMFAISMALIIYLPQFIFLLSFLPQFFKSLVEILVFFSVIIFSSYALIISMNVFNVSRYKRLPLLQAAQTIVYVFSSVGGYLLLNVIHHFFFAQWYILIPAYVIASGYLIFINNWSVKISSNENILYTLIGIFAIAQIVIALSFIPLSQYVFPLVVTICIYIYCGIINHLNKKNIIFRTSVEYIILGVIILGVIVLSSGWGIAGNIFGR